MFFLDKDTPDNKSGKNIFISSLERDRETVTSARSGHVENIGDDQFLLLFNGQRLENSLKGEGLRISEFDEHGTRVREGTSPGRAGGRAGQGALHPHPAVAAPQSPINRGELAWRLGLALAGINFVLLAITVSSVNPRVGRSGNLVFALFAFVISFNLLNMGQSWVATGRMQFLPFMLLLHGGTLALAALWLAKQHNNWALAPLLRRLLKRRSA